MIPRRVSFGPFVFDGDLSLLVCNEQPVALPRSATALLAALLHANGGVVGKSALMEAAWPDAFVEEANLFVQIGVLRRALGARPDGSGWITTVPRIGYRLNRFTPRMLADVPAIAVLPFVNFGDDPDFAFFADGMVEELITALSRFKTFAVIARSSSFALRHAGDVRQIAQDLGARYLLGGSVRRSGARVRVTAQLIEGETGIHLWADRFEGSGTDVFDIQDGIVDRVVGLVEPQIRRAEVDRARHKRPQSLDAWDDYVQALPDVFSTRVAGYDAALSRLQKTIALEPGYAPALALAAWAHERRWTIANAPRGAEDIPASLALIDRALSVDPDDPLVLALAGWLRTRIRKDYAAIALTDRALELNPHSVLVLDLGGAVHLHAGSLDTALACARRGAQLSPRSPDEYIFLLHIASAYSLMGQFEDAVARGRRSIAVNPNYVFSHLNLAASLSHLGLMTEARSELAAALAIRPTLSLSLLTEITPMRFPDRLAIWIEGLRTAGLS